MEITKFTSLEIMTPTFFKLFQPVHPRNTNRPVYFELHRAIFQLYTIITKGNFLITTTFENIKIDFSLLAMTTEKGFQYLSLHFK